jgi:hypothetical protein
LVASEEKRRTAIVQIRGIPATTRRLALAASGMKSHAT